MDPIPKSGYHYANKIVLIALKALEEVMGKNGVNAILNLAHLPLVVGSQNSSNSTRLMEISQKAGVPAHLIDNAVEKNGNGLTINLGIRFPDNGFKQILCNTYGSIVSKEFSMSIGCWKADLYMDSDGNGYPDWWDSGLVRRASRSPYDARTATPPYVYSYRYCGTGPYRITTFDPVGLRVVLQKNPGYWKGWPAAGSNSSLDTIEIDCIASWVERKTAFFSGAIDTCAATSSAPAALISVMRDCRTCSSDRQKGHQNPR